MDHFYDDLAPLMHAELCGKLDCPTAKTVPGRAYEAVPRTVAETLKTTSNPKPSLARAVHWLGARLSELHKHFRIWLANPLEPKLRTYSENLIWNSTGNFLQFYKKGGSLRNILGRGTPPGPDSFTP